MGICFVADGQIKLKYNYKVHSIKYSIKTVRMYNIPLIEQSSSVFKSLIVIGEI